MKRFLLVALAFCLLLCPVMPAMADAHPITVAIMENGIVSLSENIVFETDPDAGQSTPLLAQDELAAAKIDSISANDCTLVNGADSIMLIDHRTQLLHIWKDGLHSTVSLASAAEFDDGFVPIQAVQTGNLVCVLLQDSEANQMLIADLEHNTVSRQSAGHMTMIAPWIDGQILAIRSQEADYSELVAIDCVNRTEVLFAGFRNTPVTGLAADPAAETYYFIVKGILCQTSRSNPEQINRISELPELRDTRVQAAATGQWYVYRHPEHNRISYIALP